MIRYFLYFLGFLVVDFLAWFAYLFCKNFMKIWKKESAKNAPAIVKGPPTRSSSVFVGLVLRIGIVAKMMPAAFMGLIVMALLPLGTVWIATIEPPENRVANFFIFLMFFGMFLSTLFGVYISIPESELHGADGRRITWGAWTEDILLGFGQGLIFMLFAGLLGAAFGKASGTGYKGGGGSSGGGGAGGKW